MPYLLNSFWSKIERQCYNTPSPPTTYSLDLVPYDFWLFSKLQSALKGTHVQPVGAGKNKIEWKGYPTSFRPMENTDGAMY